MNKEKFLKLPKFNKCNINPLIKSKSRKRYRNNILFSIGKDLNGKIQVGPMSTIKKFKIVNNSETNLEVSFLGIFICNLIKRWILNFTTLKILDYNTGKGFWRHIQIRENINKDYLVCFRFSNFEENEKIWDNEKKKFTKYLKEKSLIKNYKLKGLYYQKCLGNSEPTKNERFYKEYYKGELSENILGYNFIISPGCFFQVNTLIAIKLYSIVQSFFEDKSFKEDILLDLCCGIGMFGIILSKKFKSVIGIDNNPQNTKLVNLNCFHNNIHNYDFIEGNVESNLDKLFNYNNNKNYNIILNPPRRGLYKELIHYINKNKHLIKHLVYVSCNIESLIRDLIMFGEKWYIEKIIPLDQFPNTTHYEFIVRMT